MTLALFWGPHNVGAFLRSVACYAKAPMLRRLVAAGWESRSGGEICAATWRAIARP
jgi:hypothetical protein